MQTVYTLPVAPLSNVPAANVAAVVTMAAQTNQVNAVSAVYWSYSAAPTAGRLTIADGATTVLDLDVTAAGPNGITFPTPIKGTAGTALTVTLAAAGASVIGKLNVVPATP